MKPYILPFSSRLTCMLITIFPQAICVSCMACDCGNAFEKSLNNSQLAEMKKYIPYMSLP